MLSSTFSTSSQNNKAYCTGAEECDSQVTKNFKHTVNSPEETVCTPDCTTNHSCVDSSSVYDKISANKDEHRNSCCDERTVPSENCCLTGLHCCGPLTPAMLELFVSNERLKSLVLVSCCYHSMPVVGKSRYERGNCQHSRYSDQQPTFGRDKTERRAASSTINLRIATGGLSLMLPLSNDRWSHDHRGLDTDKRTCFQMNSAARFL